MWAWMVVCLYMSALWWSGDLSRLYPALAHCLLGLAPAPVWPCKRISDYENEWMKWMNEWMDYLVSHMDWHFIMTFMASIIIQYVQSLSLWLGELFTLSSAFAAQQHVNTVHITPAYMYGAVCLSSPGFSCNRDSNLITCCLVLNMA